MLSIGAAELINDFLKMKIYLGADHRGFKLKEELKKVLVEKGYEIEDLGAFKYEQNDDYPDFALAVAEQVAKNLESRGVLICGSGTGMDTVANKVKGVRATLVSSAQIAQAARNDDDVNVISLPADFLKPQEAEEIAEIFLKTPFETVERRERRLRKISEIEKKNFR